LDTVDRTKSKTAKLVPPGKVFHIYKTVNGEFVMERAKNEDFQEIVVANDMYMNHMPLTYENAFHQTIECMQKKTSD